MDLQEYLEFVRVIHGDVKACVEKINEKVEVDFWARMYVRSLATYIEGIVYVYRNIFHHLGLSGEMQLGVEQKLFFGGTDWSIGKNGSIKLFEKKIPTQEFIKSLLVQIGLVLGDYEPDFTSNGWNRLMQFYPVRDSLVHPKGINSVHISREKIIEIDEGREWLVTQISLIGNSLMAKFPANKSHHSQP